MNADVEVRIRHEDESAAAGTPAFSVPWDKLEEARKTFQQWGVSIDGETYHSAWGTIVVEPGKLGSVWFDVMVSNDE